MTFTYTPASPDDVTRVRFALGDTLEAQAIFSDEEISFTLSEAGSVGAAVVMCIRTIIAQLSEPDFQADWLRVSASEARKSWERMLSEKKREYGISTLSASGTFTYRVDSDAEEAPYGD